MRTRIRTQLFFPASREISVTTRLCSCPLVSHRMMFRACLRAFSSSGPALKQKKIKFNPMPLLNEADLEETFIRGTGPGGQKINKTSVVVQLRHIPTGLSVKCQDTRMQGRNRIAARKLLRTKLDNLTWGDQSMEALKRAALKRKGQSAQKKRNRKYRPTSESPETAVSPTDVD